MNEIEIKILDINKQEIVNKILELGGKKLYTKELNAVFFKAPQNQVIRVRKEGDIVIICHKQKINTESGVKAMDETEIESNDFETSLKLLNKLGFKQNPSNIRKTRTSYKLNNCKIEFDKLHDKNEFVPEFLEIEGTNQNDVYQIAKLLGFTKEQCLDWNGNKVIEYYK